MTSKRDAATDILKGLAIFLVVVGHVTIPGNHFIKLFHMPVFFIASGYFFKSKYSDSFKSTMAFIVRRVKGIWLPYFIATVIFLLLHNVLIDLHIYTNDPAILQYVPGKLVRLTEPMSTQALLVNLAKAVLFSAHTDLGGTFWFFKTLFGVACAYCVLDFAIKHFIKKEPLQLMFQGFFSFLFLLAGYYCFLNNLKFSGIELCLSAYSLYFLGYMAARFHLVDRWRTPAISLAAAVSFVILLILNRFFDISMNVNRLDNPFVYLLAAVSGFIMLYGIARILNRYFAKSLGWLFGYMGEHSLSMMIGHFLCFKGVNALYALANGFPLVVTAAFPVATETFWWQLVYVIFGCAIPLLVQYLYHQLPFVRPAHAPATHRDLR